MALTTALYSWHLEHGAKMLEFGGYLMPLDYGSVLAEHQAVREACGLFDISHMGEIWISGREALDFVQRVTSNDAAQLQDRDAQYSLLLNEKSYALDDILVYRLSAEKFLLCVNAANIQQDFAWLQKHKFGEVQIENRSADTGMIALQGPQSAAVLAVLGFKLETLQRFQITESQLAQIPVLLSRTGYTGEQGAELFVDASRLVELWEALFQIGQEYGLKPVGLGARDTLRLEMGYVLYGHELSADIHPLEAGLNWVIKPEAKDFIGREAFLEIQRAGVSRRVVGLVLQEPGIPRQDMEVYTLGKKIGRILSGTMSPTLKKGVATALLEKDMTPSSGFVTVDIRGKKKAAQVRKFPFIPSA